MSGLMLAATNVLFADRSLADHSLLRRNKNLGDRRGEESCLLSRIADRQVRDENAVSPGSSVIGGLESGAPTGWKISG
ncbi:MAG: hypothetical protein ACK5YO_02705 [Planctomyces sp.]